MQAPADLQRSLARPAFSAGEAGQRQCSLPYRHHRARTQVSQGDDQEKQERGDDHADDPRQRRSVQRPDLEAARSHRAARVIPVAATGAGGRPAARRGDAEDRRVAAIVAQTWVLAGLATQDGRVVAQVVGGRLERNPAVRLLVRRRRWEVGLDPGVGILAPDHEVVQVLVLLAGTVAADQADRDAEGAEHVAHRGREIFAVALLRFEQEVLDRVSALRRLRRRQRVGEVAAVTQVVLDGGRLVVGPRGAGIVHDFQGETVDLVLDLRGPVAGRERPVLIQPRRVGRPRVLEVGDGGGRILDGGRVIARRRRRLQAAEPVDRIQAGVGVGGAGGID